MNKKLKYFLVSMCFLAGANRLCAVDADYFQAILVLFSPQDLQANQSDDSLAQLALEKLQGKDSNTYDISSKIYPLLTVNSTVVTVYDSATTTYKWGWDLPVLFNNGLYLVGKQLPLAPTGGAWKVVVLQTHGGLFANLDGLGGSGTVFQSLVQAFDGLLENKGIIDQPLPPFVGDLYVLPLHWEYDEQFSS
jgi:hypothetical protein